MPARDHGWVGPKRRSTKVTVQRRTQSSAGRGNAATKGAVHIRYVNRTGILENKPWRVSGPNWGGPVTEWAIYWYLSIHGVKPNDRKLRRNFDYFYQAGVPAPGLFATKPFFRADFVIPGYGKGVRGVVLDPETPFTHPSPKDDRDKRQILATQGFQWIAIDADALRVYPGTVIELALHGIDVSYRGRAAQANG
jgi:hypothetical protein